MELFSVISIPQDIEWKSWMIRVLEGSGLYQFSELQLHTLGRDRYDLSFVLMIVSEESSESIIQLPEWTWFYQIDSIGKNQMLKVVKVSQATLKGLLGAIYYIDLYGVDVDTRATILLEGVRKERKVPKTPPPFPGF